MPRLAACLLLTLTVITTGHSLTIDPEEVRNHAEAVRSTYPRPEASEGERLLISYIEKSLDSMGARYSMRDFQNYQGGHSFSRIIEVVVPGTGTDTMIIAVPINHPDGLGPDQDGSASIAAVLGAVHSALTAEDESSYRFLFLGAEYGEGASYPMGINRFLQLYFPEGNNAAIYLEAGNAPIVLESGGQGVVAPDWLVESVMQAGAAAGIRPLIRSELNQLHRLGISSPNPRLLPLLQRGIPAVLLRSDEPDLTAPSVADDAVALGRLLSIWTTQMSGNIRDEWDQHYLYFPLGSRRLIIREGAYLRVLLALLFCTLLYGLLFRGRLARYVRTIGRNLWNLPVLFALMFGFLFAGTLLLRLFLVLRNSPTFWQHDPLTFLAHKILLSIFFFTAVAAFLRHLPLSKNGSFYSASALFVLLIDIVLFSVLSLSVGYYFIWAFGFAFLFSVARRRWVKTLALLISPFFLLRIAFEVLSVPELTLSNTLLLTITGDLVLAFITFPFLLMLIRLDFLIRHPVAGRRGYALRMVSVVTGVLVVGLSVYAAVRQPYSTESPQPVSALETVDYSTFTRSLRLESPAPLGNLVVQFDGRDFNVDPGARIWSVSSDRLPDVLSVRLTTDQFLDRDRASLTIDAPQNLDSISILLSSPEPMEIYDVNFPFVITPDQREARVFVGARPGLPLEVEYTLARGSRLQVDIEAYSSTLSSPISVSGETIGLTSNLLVRTRFAP